MRRVLVLGLVVTWACSERGPTATSTPAESSTPTATPTANPTASPPPKPALPAFPVARAVALEPAGAAPLSGEGETVVDPASAFEVELALRAADARLVLLDAADAHVPARVAREVGATTRLSLAPAAPLVPASRYVLRVEGWSERELHDADGRAFRPRTFVLLAAGTAPPPEPKRRPKATRRR